MSKSQEAFRTISEVADDLDVPKHVLRFWEVKFPQIKPMKRGGGRRFYRPEDLELLRGIRHLLHAEGYTIKGVQKILREQGVDSVKTAAAAASTAMAEAAKARGKAGRRPSRDGAGPAVPAPRNVAVPRSAIDKLIAELEACRKLLSPLAAAAAAPAGRKAARASSRARP